MSLTPSTLFRALSDETRLDCLLLLAAEGELCVCELTHALDVAQPKISRHLASLREAGIVSDRRAGQWIYYQLHSALPAWARTILDQTLATARRGDGFQARRRALKTMPNRPNARCCA